MLSEEISNLPNPRAALSLLYDTYSDKYASDERNRKVTLLRRLSSLVNNLYVPAKGLWGAQTTVKSLIPSIKDEFPNLVDEAKEELLSLLILPNTRVRKKSSMSPLPHFSRILLKREDRHLSEISISCYSKKSRMRKMSKLTVGTTRDTYVVSTSVSTETLGALLEAKSCNEECFPRRTTVGLGSKRSQELIATACRRPAFPRNGPGAV